MKSKGKILIVDDEPNIRRILQAAFERSGYVTRTAETGEEAIDKLTAEGADLVLTDVMMPGMTGVELLKRIKQTLPEVPVLVMTAYGTIPQAVEAIKAGAGDYIPKPFDLEHIRKAAAYWIRTPSKPRVENKLETNEAMGAFISASPKMQEVAEFMKQIATARATVLITGESGTGKEQVAKAIHRLSDRASGPFVAVSCAALPETLLESELFGHEKGAFTGADNAKPGRFELADGGTLLLDEVGEIPPLIQVKLLRVLQEREFERLGGTTPVKTDVRLIAATNRDLPDAVEAGTFRQDLLFRLQVLTIELPPLREREEDIEPLALHFLKKYSLQEGKQIQSVTDSALSILKSHSWPGNVRELENVIERAVVLAGASQIELLPDLLPPALRKAA
ncbi:MAG: sigma-54 dependent transcriptional regulator [Fimbriimonadales bacterium]